MKVEILTALEIAMEATGWAPVPDCPGWERRHRNWQEMYDTAFRAYGIRAQGSGTGYGIHGDPFSRRSRS